MANAYLLYKVKKEKNMLWVLGEDARSKKILTMMVLFVKEEMREAMIIKLFEHLDKNSSANLVLRSLDEKK
ncbi:hypothetical protein NQX30_00345 [Candidatus Persebacteraceae bacterium Df01]|uniref:Uncharacterized protein n=1 Tax=Candidatus Doriopsillibacter californiensis TaxID=2970740 RepID=A0ABT7QJD9_9GAMM|nr:hypothetical protein [Candidatus Persebacteraceae bacterium Df01]